MTTVRALIDQHAATRPDSTFFVSPELSRSMTFAALREAVDGVGARLDAMGVERGARVAFLLNNGLWTVELFLGVMASGRVIVPLNAVAGKVQLTHVLSHSDAEVVLVAPEYRERLDELLAGVEREVTIIEVTDETGPAWPLPPSAKADARAPQSSDPALLLYTSGSTGLPKGAILSHRAVCAGGANVVEGHQLSADDRALCVLPVYHINGAMVTVMAPLVSGGSVVMPERFSASAFWSLVAEHGCTWASIVPTIIKYLLDRAGREPYDFGNDPKLAAFRFARSASAPLAAVVLEEWERVFKVPMIETMGLTETAATIATNPMPPRPRKPGSVGIAMGNEIRVVDDDGNEVADGVVGELVIRGDNLLDHYHKNEEATEAAFRDGWFRTGDLGYRDEEGYLFVSGRLKELIIRGGENIAPREIDDVLYKHESILEAAAVGVDDEMYGQEVVACVAVREGYSCTAEELMRFCEDAVGKYKAPKVIYFFDELPKGPSGKILRLKLPAMIQSRTADSVAG